MAVNPVPCILCLLSALSISFCAAIQLGSVESGASVASGTAHMTSSCGWPGRRSPPETTSAIVENRPQEVNLHMERVCGALHKLGKNQTCEMFRKAYPNTVDTTMEETFMSTGDGLVQLDDSLGKTSTETFVSTGDIPDMWLRDSSAQVNHYISLLDRSGGSEKLKHLLTGLFHHQMGFYLSSPYANAFRKNGSVAEEKYELDSVCYAMNLGYRIWKQTGDDAIFTNKNNNYLTFLEAVLTQWTTEQFHDKQSKYRGDKNHPLPRNPSPVKTGIGLIWQGYRPSDDPCTYHYNIPGNMMAAVQLKHAEEVLKTVFANELALAARTRDLRKQIDLGIDKFGRGQHSVHGEIYAYEVDGLGKQIFMDDANVPSLLSIPYVGYSSPHHNTDLLYNRTRLFVLSDSNPYYFTGLKAKGIGSAHTSPGCIWHLGVIMEALTTKDPAEKLRLLSAIESTTAGTGRMHESFAADDDQVFTRGWFGWAASLYSELVEGIAL